MPQTSLHIIFLGVCLQHTFQMHVCTVSFIQGETLLVAGEPADTLMVLAEGEVEQLQQGSSSFSNTRKAQDNCDYASASASA